MRKIEWPKNRLAPGVYFGLPEKIYHTDPALGSTDIRVLKRGGHLYWHRSWMNPTREPFDDDLTAARITGKAIHKLLLEGRQAFEASFIRRPNDPPGATSGDKGTLTKAAKKHLLEHQNLLHGDDFDFISSCGDLIEAHPDLGTVLEGGAREVSVVFDKEMPGPDDGDPVLVRCKVRFDLLKPRGIGDLKSIANERDLPLKVACRNDIASHRYPLQFEHYLDGRRHLPALVKAGAVHTWPDYQPDPNHTLEFLERVAAEKQFAFQVIFIPKNGDPDACSWTLSPANPILRFERDVIDGVLQQYIQLMETHGTDRWPLVDRVEELSQDELPQWYGRE